MGLIISKHIIYLMVGTLYSGVSKQAYLSGGFFKTHIYTSSTYIQDEFMDVKGVVARILGKKAKLS